MSVLVTGAGGGLGLVEQSGCLLNWDGTPLPL